MKTKSILYLLGIFLLCFLGNIILHFSLEPVVVSDAGYIFEIPHGASKNRVIDQLKNEGIIRHTRLLTFYADFKQHDQIKAGEYFFPKGSTAISIWQQITHGTGLYLRSFTIVPGWTFQELRRALQTTVGLQHTASTLTDQMIMQRLGASNLNPEGEFFPETYCYTKGISDLIILKQAFNAMQKKLQEAWSTRTLDLPYKNAYEALIAASLIEKEAYLKSERPLIAGVLVNRLKKEMLLQFDPTVIYGLGERYQGKLYKASLLEDTLYNTYLHKGLPPTPIAMPSFSSLQAALHPTEHDYYYFVAKGDGSHQFSKTLLEHHDAVKAVINTEIK